MNKIVQRWDCCKSFFLGLKIILLIVGVSVMSRLVPWPLKYKVAFITQIIPTSSTFYPGLLPKKEDHHFDNFQQLWCKKQLFHKKKLRKHWHLLFWRLYKANLAHFHPNLKRYYLCASTQTLPKALQTQTINDLTLASHLWRSARADKKWWFYVAHKQTDRHFIIIYISTSTRPDRAIPVKPKSR